MAGDAGTVIEDGAEAAVRGFAVFEFGTALSEGGELGGGEAGEGIAEARAAGLGRGDGAWWGDASLGAHAGIGAGVGSAVGTAGLGDDDDLTEGQCGQQDEGSAGSRFHGCAFWFARLAGRRGAAGVEKNRRSPSGVRSGCSCFSEVIEPECC